MISHQASRYELKYLIPEAQAGAIRQQVLSYLQPDDNTAPDSIGYRVQSLYLDSNQIDDIRALKYLAGLNRLVLSDNRVSDISPLSGLKKLTWLEISNNQIIDISPLADLTGLKFLDLSRNWFFPFCFF